MRCLILLAILLAPPLFAETDVVTDGSRGVDGTDGTDYSGSGFSGRGKNGTHGTAGTNGTHAGNISLRLFFEGDRYKMIGTAGNRSIDSIYGATEGFRLSAQGGDGGHGGRGGDAGQGAQGYRGEDATPGRSGTSGGPGHPGGDGGDGAPGGNGGNGGEILVVAPFDDIALFALMQGAQFSGGALGSGGRAGQAGAGGLGGSGGSGLTWYTTETRQVTRSRQVPHTASRTVPTYSTRTLPNGQTEISTGSTTETYTEYSTEYYQDTESYQQPHYESGGSSGYPGSSGSSGSSARSGSPGRDGSFAFVIDYGGGNQKRYQRLFNLSLSPYRIVDKSGDGIFEPGESGIVDAFVVSNSGEMPTPPGPKSSFKMFLQGDGMRHLDPTVLTVPKSLDPGASHSFDDKIGFSVRDVEGPSQGEAYSGRFTINPRATLSPVERSPSDFHRPVTNPVQFPVMFRMDAPPTLAQGEQGRVRLHITNISNSTLGGDGSEKRLLSMFLKDHEGLASRTMSFAEEETAAPKSLRDGVELALKDLAPGQTRTIEGILSVPQDFPPQTAFSFDTSLKLGRLDEPTQAREIQDRSHRLSIASKYHTEPDADIALVINGETRSEELDAWKNLLEDKLGFKVVTWNVTYYGNFDLDKEFIESPRWHLLRDFRGKTIIVLNNRFKSYSGHQTTAWESLSRTAFIRAIGEFDVNFLILTPDGQRQRIFDVFARTKAGDGSRTYSSTDNLIRGLDVLHRERLSANVRAPLKADFHRVKVIGKHYFAAKESELKSKAELLDRQLRLVWPERHYLVSYDFKNEILDPGGVFSSANVYVGDLVVQRMPDSGDDIAVVADAPSLQSPEYINSEENMAHVVSSFSPNQRLTVLCRLLSRANDVDDEATHALGTALVNEMIRSVLADYETALHGEPRRGSQSPRTIAHLRNWRYDVKIKPGSLADKLVKHLYSRALIAGYYSHGKNKAAAQSAAQDLEFWGQQLYASSAEWSDAKEDIKADWDSLFKSAGTAYWSYNATNHAKIHEVLVSQTRPQGREYLGQADEVRVIPYAEIEALRESEAAWSQKLSARMREDQAARTALRLDPSKRLEASEPTP